MRAVSVVDVRLEEVAGERLVVLRMAGGEIARLEASEARDLAVRLLEVAYEARPRRRVAR